LLSYEYGWETEYILSRTFREIEYRLYAIDRRRKIEQANQMALRGVKPNIAIPARRVSLKKTKEDVEVDKQAEDQIMRAFEQRKAEWQKKD